MAEVADREGHALDAAYLVGAEVHDLPEEDVPILYRVPDGIVGRGLLGILDVEHHLIVADRSEVDDLAPRLIVGVVGLVCLHGTAIDAEDKAPLCCGARLRGLLEDLGGHKVEVSRFVGKGAAGPIVPKGHRPEPVRPLIGVDRLYLHRRCVDEGDVDLSAELLRPVTALLCDVDVGEDECIIRPAIAEETTGTEDLTLSRSLQGQRAGVEELHLLRIYPHPGDLLLLTGGADQHDRLPIQPGVRELPILDHRQWKFLDRPDRGTDLKLPEVALPRDTVVVAVPIDDVWGECRTSRIGALPGDGDRPLREILGTDDDILVVLLLGLAGGSLDRYPEVEALRLYRRRRGIGRVLPAGGEEAEGQE